VRYPSFQEELEIARRTTSVIQDDVEPVLSASEILELQRLVREVPIADHVIRYTLALVRQTRRGEAGVPDFIGDQVSWGAGPRAVQFLILGAKARALLNGRAHVSTSDIQALARPVLRHRLVLNFAAESEGVTAEDVIDRLVQTTPDKEDELTRDSRFQKIFAS
jgi:MoxR-like ATPase